MSMPIQIDQKHALTTRQTANRTDGFSSTELRLDWQIHPGLKCDMALCFQHIIIISPDTKKQQQKQHRNQQFKTNSIGCDSFAVKFALFVECLYIFFLLPRCLARHSNSYLESNIFFFMAFFYNWQNNKMRTISGVSYARARNIFFPLFCVQLQLTPKARDLA